MISIVLDFDTKVEMTNFDKNPSIVHDFESRFNL